MSARFPVVTGWREMVGAVESGRDRVESQSETEVRLAEKREVALELFRTGRVKVSTISRALDVSRMTVFRWRRQWLDRSV